MRGVGFVLTVSAIVIYAFTGAGAAVGAQEALPPDAVDASDATNPPDAADPPDAIAPPAWPRSTAIVPAPRPFSLNGYDALQARGMIRRERLLIRRVGTEREIVPVRAVEIVPTGRIETFPLNHRRRYDLNVNGQPLQWDRTYINYGGRLVNLQLLFTYRNQRPVPDVPFYLE